MNAKNLITLAIATFTPEQYDQFIKDTIDGRDASIHELKNDKDLSPEDRNGFIEGEKEDTATVIQFYRHLRQHDFDAAYNLLDDMDTCLRDLVWEDLEIQLGIH